MKKPSPRSRERVLLAAAKVDVADMREAAILGGIVSSLLDGGRFTANYVKHATVAALQWAMVGHTSNDILRLFPDVTMPSDGEVRAMARRFREQYDPPTENVA